jgi:Domain of unknown function (DUF4349)/Putative zinc-finger
MDRSLQHEFDAEEVMAYLDGELEARRAAMLASHLEHCAECQRVAAEMRQLSGRMLKFEIEPMPAGVTAATLIELTTAAKQEAPKEVGYEPGFLSRWRKLATKRSVWAFAGAFGVVVILVGGVGILNVLRSRPAANVAATHMEDLAVPSAQPLAPASRGYNARMQGEIADLQQARKAMEESALSSNLESRRSEPSPPATVGGEISAPGSVGPMIVQTASLSIVAKNYDEASATIEKLVKARGGYVEKLDGKAQTGNAREMSVTLRIPAKQLDGFMVDLRQLGHVEQESQSNEEVSADYVDLQARLKSAQATERRLIELLGTRTGRLEDVLDAERELARVRAEIESMQGQSAVMVHRVDYATVEVQLSEEYHERLQSRASTGAKLWNALVEGVQNLEDGIVGLLIFVLNYGLSILFWLSIFIVPSWLIWRRRRSRSLAKSGAPFQRT